MNYVYYQAPNNEIYAYELPDQQELVNEAIANEWENVTDSYPFPPEPPTAEQNKATASNLLSQTDWTTIADVADPLKSNPYLDNQADFVAYRNEVRQYAVYPVAGNINFPSVPAAIWKKLKGK